MPIFVQRAVQSAVACSKATGGGLLASCQWKEGVLVSGVSSCSPVQFGFLLNTNESLGFRIRIRICLYYQVYRGHKEYWRG